MSENDKIKKAMTKMKCLMSKAVLYIMEIISRTGRNNFMIVIASNIAKATMNIP